MARKQKEADQLRAAEKFMVVGTGEAECTSCGFIYDPRKGDPEYPVGPGTQFSVRSASAQWQGHARASSLFMRLVCCEICAISHMLPGGEYSSAFQNCVIEMLQFQLISSP